MKNFLVTFTFLLMSLITNCQDNHFGTKKMTLDELEIAMSVIRPNALNFSVDSFNLHFEKKLNDYRVSKNCETVKYDKTIVKVAMEQSDYCIKLGSLIHRQTILSKEWPKNRCNFHGIDCMEANENLFMGHLIFCPLSVYSDGRNYYDCLSEVIISAWKKSPGHNRTLLSYGEIFSVGISHNKENEMVACLVLVSL